MTTLTILYGTATAITCTTTGLASDSNLLAGRVSNVVDNTSTLADDYMIGGQISTKSGSIAALSIEVWLYGLTDGTNYTAGLASADAAATITSTNLKNTLALLTVITSDAFATTPTYTIGPYSVATTFGGVLPSKWGFWIVHNVTGGASNQIGATALFQTSIKYTSA